ncbi:MAG: glycosyltransferase family 4 protein [Proteobacteria bacterium]|nr:glycosyltransferase family 4 protein [Pseudomonadota bacterium]
MPKPKGGGASIILIVFCLIVVLSVYQLIDKELSQSLMAGLFIVSVIGLIDDLKNLSVVIRAAMYLFAALLSIYFIGGLPALEINNYTFDLSYLGYVFSVFFVVWLINLYNFMDGTDGFAAIQTISVSLFCGLILYFSGHISFSIIFFCIVSSTIGFLYWNWAPAKIFMGDVGSCSLGFLFGILAIYTEKKGILSISVWLVLLTPFVGDATFTLLKRIINREKWYKAHNSHAYQRLYQLGVSHDKLAVSLLFLNVLVFWPLAYFANSYDNLELTIIILSYFIIGFIWMIIQFKYEKIINGSR